MPDQVLTITLTEQGNIQLNGPLTNRVLCFGMLEWAKDVVRDYCEQQPKPPTPPEVRQ